MRRISVEEAYEQSLAAPTNSVFVSVNGAKSEGSDKWFIPFERFIVYDPEGSWMLEPTEMWVFCDFRSSLSFKSRFYCMVREGIKGFLISSIFSRRFALKCYLI